MYYVRGTDSARRNPDLEFYNNPPEWNCRFEAEVCFFQKSHRVVFNRVRNLVFEKFQRLFSGGSDGVLGVAVRGFCMDQIGIDQITDDLLDTEIIGVVLFEKKFEICVLVNGKSTLSNMFKIVNLYMVNGSAIYIHLFLLCGY